MLINSPIHYVYVYIWHHTLSNFIHEEVKNIFTSIIHSPIPFINVIQQIELFIDRTYQYSNCSSGQLLVAIGSVHILSFI